MRFPLSSMCYSLILSRYLLSYLYFDQLARAPYRKCRDRARQIPEMLGDFLCIVFLIPNETLSTEDDL